MSSLKMAMGVSLLASVPALATPYEWNGADGTTTLGDVTVEKSGGVASLTGSNASWTYSDPSSFDSLTGVDLISATTLSSLTVADGVDFKARAGTLDQGEGALPTTIAVNHARATFVASGDHSIVSTSTISGTAGVVSFTGDGTGGIEMGDDSYQTALNTPIVTSESGNWEVLSNTRLEDLVSVVGEFYSGSRKEAGSYFFKNNGQTASVQLQAYVGAKVSQDSVLGGVIDFKQDGNDILYRQRYASAYYNRAANPGYEEAGSWEFAITESGGKIYPVSGQDASWASTWKLANLTFSFKSKIGSFMPVPMVALSSAAAFVKNSGSRIEFGDVQGSPVDVTVSSKSAFASAGVAIVHSNATLTLSVDGDYTSGYGLSGDDTPFYILMPSAKMLSKGSFSVGRWQGVEIGDGAKWEQLDTVSTYLSSLKYHAGAKTIGKINLGQGASPSIVVSGQGTAAVHEGKIRVDTSVSQTATFNVTDVTGSSDADYIIAGEVCEMTAGRNNDIVFRKTGNGTLRLGAPFTLVRYPFQLINGTLEFGASGVSSASLNWIAKGASSLVCASGTTNTIGNLSLEANLTIEMKANAELSITSISEWAGQYPGVQLNIIAEEGARVRIGQSAADLPVSVRTRMRLNGQKCQADANGYIEYRPGGLMLILR